MAMDGIWASDGSDYDISLNSCNSVAEEDSEDDIGSINSTNYHNEIDGIFPEERILQHCDIEYVPPKGTDGSKLSVERLRELIEQHRQTRTVKKFLCDIDTESGLFDAEYTDIDTSNVDIHNLPNNEKPVVKSYLISKTYCTMLGFACLDPNGPRGEEKIRLILDTARRYHINLRLFLATFSKRIFKWGEHTHTWIDKTKEQDNWRTTPLQLVISNDHSTPESIRMIACAWPRAVFIRGDVEDETKTLLMEVVHSCSYDHSGESIERLKNITDALFEAAEKTKEGARGLVMMSDSANIGVVNYFDAYMENESEQTVLHIATSYYYDNPEEVLSIFLKVWPDAMLKLGEHHENCGDYPFHNVFRFAKTYESLVKCIEVFLQHSTLPAFASCLLYVNSKDGVYAFDLLLEALQSPEITKIRPFHPMKCETIWQERLKAEVNTLLSKKDLHGRTFLHHIVVYNREDDDLDEGHRRGMIMREDLRHLINRDLWHDDDNDIDDELSNELLRVWKRHQREKMEKVGKIAQWILNQDNELVNVVDNDGLNPLQYAVSIGKKWSEGLDILVKIVPDWSQPPKNNTLCPFAMSGYASNDLDTTFQLLRHDATVIHNMTTL